MMEVVLEDGKGALQLAGLAARDDERVERVRRRPQAQQLHLVVELRTGACRPGQGRSSVTRWSVRHAQRPGIAITKLMCVR